MIEDRVALGPPVTRGPLGLPGGKQPFSLATTIAAARDVGYVLLLVGLPLLASIAYAWHLHAIGGIGFDFAGTIWHPLHDSLRGLDPYPAARFASLDVGNPSVYPPLAFLLAAPLAALPYSVAVAFWIALLVVAVAAALYIAGARDWRCYAVALMSFPVVHGLTFGNVTLLLVPIAAAAWALRRHEVVSGLLIGVAIAMKIFLWPLALWLLATRRFKGAAAAVLSTALFLVASWATIGFEGMRQYPRLLDALTSVFAVHSVSPAALLIGAGASDREATVVVLGAGLLLAFLCLGPGRRHFGDEASFTLAIAVALVASPVVWPHYYALLVVPAAILWPRYGRVWVLFPLSWLVGLFVPGAQLGHGSGPANVPTEIWHYLHGGPPSWQIGGYLVLLGVIVVSAVRSQRESSEPSW